MEIKKDPKTGLFSLEGMTEGKLLCLKRNLHKPFVEAGTRGSLIADIYTCIEKGVNLHISFGTKETD